MKKTETIDLIKGTFTPDEAREILLRLLADKIKFHTQKNWRTRDRLGKPDAESEQRLKDLEESQKTLKAFISRASNEGENIIINSSIELSIE